MLREARAVAFIGWSCLALSVLETIARTSWEAEDGIGLPLSEGVPYGILCSIGFALTARVLRGLVRANEVRGARPNA
ncbi:MAG TPA: hypothetical protein VII78_17760 [Myxococcota bacterium]|jgi:hypothetical protein